MFLTGARILKIQYEVKGAVFNVVMITSKLENAIDFLRKNVEGEFRISMLEDVGRANIITDEVVDVIVKTRIKPKTEVEQKPVDKRKRPK